ncbi:MAG: ferrochelatase [Myxococcales bacterium]|nr:ferrochelatase [Myxococcales bacterium]
MKKAVLLVAHGTVESLDDLPAFLANIRRGHAPPDDLVAEVRRRYEAIGGRSPLLDTSRRLAAKVSALVGVPARVAMRLWHPYPAEVLGELAPGGPLGVAVVPLAQHSAAIYAGAVREAAAALPDVKVAAAANWGLAPGLVAAFAARLERALAALGDAARADTEVLFSAHSLPAAVAASGDPYEHEVRQSARAIAEATPRIPEFRVCFQSQGMSKGPGGRTIEWLGPDLRAALVDAKARGKRRVVVAPVGFLSDHVEILYDLDIEAAAWASELGISLSRTESLNDGDDLARVVADLARPLLAELG